MIAIQPKATRPQPSSAIHRWRNRRSCRCGTPLLSTPRGLHWRTRWNRQRFGIEKAHALDALCVGDVAGVQVPVSRTLSITAQGRGSYQRTNVDESGFPRGYLTRERRSGGFSTGDLVRARVPEHLKAGGVHVGWVAVRASGSFRVGKLDGSSAKYCQVVQRADGYGYALRNDAQGGGASSPRVHAGASAPQ